MMMNLQMLLIGIILTLNLQAQRSPLNYYNGTASPQAPHVELSQKANEIKIDLSNPVTSNNYNESYDAIDTTIHNGNPRYVFQGYIVYQALDNTVNPRDNFFDTSKMRVVGQSDIADSIDTLMNYYYDTLTAGCDSALMVEGNNQGVARSYTLNKDAFTGKVFEIGKTYCYYVFAYAYNATKIGKECKKGWPVMISKRSSYGYGLKATCLTFGSTSIDGQHRNEIDLTYYPNPTQNDITVLLSKKAKQVDVQVTNVHGQQLLNKKLYNTTEIKIETRNFSKGIYFASITADDGQRTIEFFRK